MSTRALIGLRRGQNFTYTYLHSDGYLEWTGRILQAHHNSAAAAKLVTGDISGLGHTGGIDRCADVDPDFDESSEDCMANLHAVAKGMGAEWIYLFQPIACSPKHAPVWAWHVACDDRTAERRLDYRVIAADYTELEVLQDKLNNLGAYLNGASTATPRATPAEMFHPLFV